MPRVVGDRLELLDAEELFFKENAMTAFIGPCFVVDGETLRRILDILALTVPDYVAALFRQSRFTYNSNYKLIINHFVAIHNDPSFAPHWMPKKFRTDST